MTIFYKCENCDHVSDDIDAIDIADWASCQDPSDVYGLPAGTCTECGAPVYEEGTFAKLDAARAMLAAMETLLAAMETPRSRKAADAWDAAHTAITAAKAAGITPAPLTK